MKRLSQSKIFQALQTSSVTRFIRIWNGSQLFSQNFLYLWQIQSNLVPFSLVLPGSCGTHICEQQVQTVLIFPKFCQQILNYCWGLVLRLITSWTVLQLKKLLTRTCLLCFQFMQGLHHCSAPEVTIWLHQLRRAHCEVEAKPGTYQVMIAIAVQQR